jgi:ribosome production factor 1
MKWLKKGIPASQDMGEPSKPLEFDVGDDDQPNDSFDQPAGESISDEATPDTGPIALSTTPPKANEYEWQWKPELETTRRTFFL